MDIDDLLAQVVPADTPSSRSTRDLQELTRLWVAERCGPELLDWPDDLMARVLGRVGSQIELIESLTGSPDPKTNFRVIVLQTELERCKFLVRSFLRARLKKIDAHPLHLQAQHATAPALLSPTESAYLSAHQALLSTHYASSFLSQFPGPLQRLDDTTGGTSMVERPDEDAAVFVRALRDVGEVAVEGTDNRFVVARGDVWVVRWSAVRAWVRVGDLEVL